MASHSPPDDRIARGLFFDPHAQPLIDACSVCGSHLALASADVDHPASAWLCGGCGAAYFGRTPDDPERFRHSSARPVAFYHVFQAATLQPETAQNRVPHRDLNRVLTYLSTLEHEGSEKRRGKRYPMALPVMTLPLGEDFRVTGPAIEMSTINISCGGAALMNSTPCDATYLAIDLTVAGWGMLIVLFEVLRVRPLVSAFEIAGRWHCRVNPLPGSKPNANKPPK